MLRGDRLAITSAGPTVLTFVALRHLVLKVVKLCLPGGHGPCVADWYMQVEHGRDEW